VWRENKGGPPADQNERISQLAEGVDYQLKHALGRDLKESVCNYAGLSLNVAGAVTMNPDFPGPGYLKVADSQDGKMLAQIGVGVFLAGAGQSLACAPGQ
jgi:hypothetical protein